MRTTYTVTVTDSKGHQVHQSLISENAAGWTYPFTAAGKEEFAYAVERSIKEHEAHLETTATTEIPM